MMCERYCLILARSVRRTFPSLSTSALILDWPERGLLSARAIASVERSVTSTLPLTSTSPSNVSPSPGLSVGVDVGLSVGVDVGLSVGVDVGLSVGVDVGLVVGCVPLPAPAASSWRNETIHARGAFQLIVTSFVDHASIESTKHLYEGLPSAPETNPRALTYGS